GADPEAMAQAARMQVELGAEIIDINMGCPVKKIVGTGSGAALLRDEPLAGRIMETVARAVPVPVTVKIRLGWDDGSRNGVAMARIAEASGMRAITVHGRTRAQMYAGQADWEAIAEIKSRVALPVIGNGDLISAEQARHLWQKSGVDGLMIGRAALGRPWIFREFATHLTTGAPAEPPSLDERKAVIIDHFHAMIAHHGPWTGHLLARKHLGWFTRGFPGGAAFRDRINHAPHAEAVAEMLHGYFDTLMASPRAA
ncbi:MAG: tRNA dihydrouridine synthase DusB, partial [Magnetococcales bacterium]|nr:tRNA dihydrouridine synthase DusB [Magnetococcales bacterium]